MIGATLPVLGFAGLVGSGIAKIAAFIVLSPLIGMVLGTALMVASTWAVHKQTPLKVDTWFRRLQLVSSAIFSYSHGTNDAQKVMGIIAVVLFGTIWKDRPFHIDWWMIISCHAAIALGTFFGGWRIVKTMGHSLTKLAPIGGFAAETGGGVTIIALAKLGIPVSTTHTITGAITGVGSTKGWRAVKWGTAGRIIWAWVFTIPASALMAVLVYGLSRLVVMAVG
ncbi:Putative low-affinity inorganic phosphate transporter [Archangium gephyra]|nr:Putative low-affinity inorganic phosphate transporter [Archangium gephyra]